MFRNSLCDNVNGYVKLKVPLKVILSIVEGSALKTSLLVCKIILINYQIDWDEYFRDNFSLKDLKRLNNSSHTFTE